MKPRLTILLTVIIIAALCPVASAKLVLSGESVWRLGYGSRYFSYYGWKLDLGGFLASQELRLDVEGEVVDGLSLEAHIDNTRGSIFQQLSVRLSWMDIDAVGGNIQYRPFIASMGRQASSIMGLSVGYRSDEFEVRITGGKASGTKGIRTFRGAASEEKILFVIDGPYLPTRSGDGLISSLNGLWSAPSGTDFDPELDEGGIVWEETSTSGALSDFMALNSLGLLVKSASNPDGSLVPGEFYNNASVDGLSGISQAYIVLRGIPEDLARTSIAQLIREYNENMGLAGDAALKYPYIIGSSAESVFLSTIIAGWMSPATASKASGSIHVKVPFSSFSSGRIFPLGIGTILPETIEVMAVSKGGPTISLDAVSGASWTFYEGRGYLEMALPADFLDEFSAVSASYSYSISQGIYFLGAGIVRGSIDAKLDGAPLREGKDFQIDYETGVLFLFKMPSAGAEGLLTVEYEYETAGVKSWIAGIGLAIGIFEDVAVKIDYTYSSTSPYFVEDETTVPVERSYDNILAGEIAWDIAPDVKLRAGIVANASTFPGSSALRPNAFNAVNGIYFLPDDSGGIWWAFLHKSGLSILSPYSGLWREIDLPATLAGEQVNSAVSDGNYWFFGTGAGIARLEPDYSGYGENFTGVSSLWKVAGTRQGMPSGEILSLEMFKGSLYAGTTIGLVSGPSSMEGPWYLYRYSAHPELGDGRIQGLASSTGILYVASSAGIASFDGITFDLIDPLPVRSMRKVEMDLGADAIAASDDGALLLAGGSVLTRMLQGRQTISATGHGNFAYVVTQSGLYSYDMALALETGLLERAGLASVCTDGMKVYVGATADQDYIMTIYDLSYPMGAVETTGPEVHGILGEDEAHYLPLDPSDNTFWGIGGILTIGYSGDRLSADAALKARSKGSTGGTGPGKPDSASLELALEWRANRFFKFTIGDTLEVNGLWSNLGKGSGIIFSNLVRGGVTWSGPFTLDISAQYKIAASQGQPTSLSHNVGISTKLQYSLAGFRITGVLSAAYKDAQPAGPFASSSTIVGAYLQLGDKASLSASYREPTPFASLLSPGGSYRSISSTFRYSAQVNTGSVSLSAKASYRRDIRNASDSADASITGIYSARQLIFLGKSFLPRVELTLSYLMPQGSESKLNAYAKLSAGLALGIFSADMSISNKLTYVLESKRIIDSGEGSITSYLHVPGWTLRPSLQLSSSYNVEGGMYIEAVGSWRAGAKLGLSSSGKVSNQASVGYSYSSIKGGKHDISISDSLSIPLMNGKMSLGAGLNGFIGIMQDDVRASNYRASLNASLAYRFNESWSVRAAGEAGLGAGKLYDSPKGIYGLELTATLRF